MSREETRLVPVLFKTKTEEKKKGFFFHLFRYLAENSFAGPTDWNFLIMSTKFNISQVFNPLMIWFLVLIKPVSNQGLACYVCMTGNPQNDSCADPFSSINNGVQSNCQVIHWFLFLHSLMMIVLVSFLFDVKIDRNLKEEN